MMWVVAKTGNSCGFTEAENVYFCSVNFKKNEKDYDATNSAVYRMLKEAENDAPSNEPGN